MRQNIIKEKSFVFAISVIEVYKSLTQVKKEFIMSKQLARCGTAIGAMVRESEFAESKADFIHKLAIAQKEANETLYWIELLHRSGYLDHDLFKKIFSNAEEILKLLTAIIKTSKANQKP